mgnify:CR=1 FL=1
MGSIKISSKVDREVWEEFRAYAEESHSMISGLLTEALQEYLQRRRVRPDVMRHLEDSVRENRELGRRLAE